MIHYQKHLTAYARKLRKGGILSEVLLWQELKKDKLGYRFLRQKPIDKFIVDFYCQPLKLAIEIDGASSHDNKMEKDKFISYWTDIEVIIKLGILDDEKFYEKAKEFLIFEN